jgi:hypothetical protein
MIVTHSRWDVFLPIGPRYYALDSTMDPILAGLRVNPRMAGADVMAGASKAYQAQMGGQPLKIVVPSRGVQFSFEKLYANQSLEDAVFSLRYVSSDANHLGLLLSGLGTVLLWLGIVGLASRHVRLGRRGAVSSVVAGAALLIATIGFLGTSAVPASGLSLAIAAMLILWAAIQRWRIWRSKPQAA